MEPERELHYPRQESRLDTVINVEIFERSPEAWDIFKFVFAFRPRHCRGADSLEEYVVEVREHGDEEG